MSLQLPCLPRDHPHPSYGLQLHLDHPQPQPRSLPAAAKVQRPPSSQPSPTSSESGTIDQFYRTAADTEWQKGLLLSFRLSGLED